ncbi:hypothetical protein [Jiangella alkaliphila]|uniref:Uncharacterized protein n=1 Tax=Jiangella alkaliphila TaxID=419479 RepID=A0A1H2LEH9_9ACTN|nr:hypothetical protein [Jiangella alkaliphila]SDU79427.1 hypothetical protein SAMN04488563_5994 [Jiangella alkaliphila]
MTAKTYRDHGAAGPQADQAVWDDATDQARITQTLHALDWPTKVKATLAGFIKGPADTVPTATATATATEADPSSRVLAQAMA